MFRGHHRKIRILFAVSDIVLVAAAFELAYWTRTRLELHQHPFFLTPPVKALLMLWSMFAWVALGFWWEIYDRIDSAHPRVILRDAFRQCLCGAASVVLMQYVWRLDLSRPFVTLFAGCAWILLCLFRLNAGTLRGAVRREFGAAHYVMVVGLANRRENLAGSWRMPKPTGSGSRDSWLTRPARPAQPRSSCPGVTRCGHSKSFRNCCAAT